jgi:hypothetical protein
MYQTLTRGRQKPAPSTEELDRDHSPQIAIARGEHITHAAGAESGNERVTAIVAAWGRRLGIALVGVLDHAFYFFGNVSRKFGENLTALVSRKLDHALVELPNFRPVAGRRMTTLPGAFHHCVSPQNSPPAGPLCQGGQNRRLGNVVRFNRI